MLCCPDEYYPNIRPAQVADALVDQCERSRTGSPSSRRRRSGRPISESASDAGDSKYAAFYYPWLAIIDPLTGQRMLIPPGGHVAGIYARSDIERGVHKAPANEVIRGLIDPTIPRGLQFRSPRASRTSSTRAASTCSATSPAAATCVWGARTMSRDPDWKYVNVRRLFIFVEESIDEATQWVVFEPNDEPLWARVRRSVGDFLTRLWMDGMLQGRREEEAFFVRCDRTTMTQDDIDNGRLIC